MENNKVLPAVLGYGAALLGVYILVRVVGGAWKKSQS
jgi:hypothetical protein